MTHPDSHQQSSVDPLVETLAEMLYERVQEHISDQWLTWPNISEANKGAWRERAKFEAARVRSSLLTEWGVRFPSGSVQSYGADEREARRFAIATTALCPDLPTLVVRQIATPWEVA